ncbi:cytidine deaminase [Mrakia frigida]|uniref:cytidine deaminase n=1 Tax=Mrakia frigida TaxID=29902 RepID=UPI003FCBFD1D
MSAPTPTSEQYESLIAAALAAKEGSYAPYSKFRVGAALLTVDGQIIKGANIENASYGAGICAERTALVKAVSEGSNKFLAIAVSSDVPTPSISPCGICRQFIREFCALDTPIVMVSSVYQAGEYTASKEGDTTVTMTLGELLPMSFGPGELELERRP